MICLKSKPAEEVYNRISVALIDGMNNFS
uniref:Uncharacterized protein n=1 Tax=Rhizophora mucronata TaxID=61149 RepID=A0A2P2QJX2_RHIMU